MAKRKKKSNDPPPSAGAGWIMTYADLMSLLMAFFVMLLASAEVDKAKFAEMGQSMRMALGTPAPQGMAEDFKVFHEQYKKEQTELKEKIDQTKKDAKQLEEILKSHPDQIEVLTHGKIIIIRMLTSGVFGSGEAEIKADFWLILNKVKKELSSIDGDIIVSGYTDNVPIETDIFRSNWELSAARAYSVIDYLAGGLNLPSDRFVLRGFGETRNLVPNDNAQNRAKNRRVEILIDQREPADKEDANKKANVIDSSLDDAPMPKQIAKVAD